MDLSGDIAMYNFLLWFSVAFLTVLMLIIRQYEGPPKIEYRGLAAESGIPHILREAKL
jgi:hypothetical protein